MNAAPRYFVLDVSGPIPATMIGSEPDLPSAPWMTGRLVPEPAGELEYALDPDYPGGLMPMYPAESVPLMRQDVVDALQAAGVDNLQLFPAVVRDPATGKEHRNYKAFNLVGIVSAADMGESVLMGTSDSALIDVDFDRLVLDDERPGGLLMFRLAEAVNAIVVHASVREHIEAAGIAGLDFLGPGEWAG